MKSIVSFISAMIILAAAIGLTTPASMSTKTVKAVPASTIFRGKVIDPPANGIYIEYYINHVEQAPIVPIIFDVQDQGTYEAVISMVGLASGSTVTFKINDQVYGFGQLDGTEQVLDLAPDEQSHFTG